jgi:hypothetical protein
MTMNSDTVSVLEGNTFVVGRRNGDFDAGPGEPHGLFHRDIRHLSRWLLTIDGQTLGPLSTDDTRSFSANFFLVPGTGLQHAVLPERIRELALHDLPGPTGSYDASAAFAEAGRG